MPYGFYDDTARVLPHPPIPLPVLLVVEEAIRLAWQILRYWPSAKFNLTTATENEITHELFEILSDDLLATGFVDGFDLKHFKMVVREPKLRNFDGAILEKMPDLIIGIADRDQIFMLSQDALFIECKPIDSSHTVGVHYAGKGIARFTKGEYAWAMQEAMMIGYADTGYTLDPKLIETLAASATQYHVIDHPKRCPHSMGSLLAAPVHMTRHARPFSYDGIGRPAVPIVLRHLWLNRF